MLRKIDSKYAEQLTTILRKFVATKDTQVRKQINSEVKRMRGGEGKTFAGVAIHIHLDILPGLFIEAEARLLPDGMPEEAEKGKVLLEKFQIRGHWRFFLAFCLQEGELLHEPSFTLGCRECADRAECYFHMITTLCFKSAHAPDLPDIAAWVRYIECKYDIYAPPISGYEVHFDEDESDMNLNLNFLEFLVESHLAITGGIMFERCPEAAIAPEEGTGASVSVRTLVSLSTRTLNGLTHAGVETVSDLILCYNTGQIMCCKSCGRKSVEEIELELAKYEVPKTKQIKYGSSYRGFGWFREFLLEERQ